MISKSEIKTEIVSQTKREITHPRITLGQGLPKSDKMDWIVQKATELGVVEHRSAGDGADDREDQGRRKTHQPVAEDRPGSCHAEQPARYPDGRTVDSDHFSRTLSPDP